MTATLNLASIQGPLTSLQRLEAHVNSRLIAKEEFTHAVLVALLAGEHVFQLGPPGTAKTALMSLVAGGISGVRSRTALISKTTTTQELFGPIDIPALLRGEYRYQLKGGMADSHLILLDEIFNSSRGLRDALLALTNERIFRPGSEEYDTPLMSAWMASNLMPEDDRAGAFWDRTNIRLIAAYLDAAGARELIKRAAERDTHKLAKLHARIAAGQDGPTPVVPTAAGLLTLTELVALQQAAALVEVDGNMRAGIEEVRKQLLTKKIEISDRRVDQVIGILRANALLGNRVQVVDGDLEFLANCWWNRPEDQPLVQALTRKMVNPVKSKAQEFLVQAQASHKLAMDAQNLTDLTAVTKAAMDGLAHLKAIQTRAESALAEAKASSPASLTPLVDVIAQIKEMRTAITNMAAGN